MDLLARDDKNPDKQTPITPDVPAALGGRPVLILPVKLCLDGCETTSTGRRLALARWLCDRQNPLTARVAVNHVWARHFGRPLVENVHDFGMRTKAPVQQPLLDWLAVEFMTHDWSLKWLHRLIVTSAAYRMDSGAGSEAADRLAADPDNQYYWRMNPRRMEAEGVRDSLLYLAGDVDWTMGGPPLDCLAGPDSPRRSLYYRYSREDKMEFLMVFDAAAVEECYRRQESIVPQQAPALENSDFVWDRARCIARRLEQEAGCPSTDTPARAFVTAAFEHLLNLCRTRRAKACEDFLARQERLLDDRSQLTLFPPPPPEPSPPDPHKNPVYRLFWERCASCPGFPRGQPPPGGAGNLSSMPCSIIMISSPSASTITLPSPGGAAVASQGWEPLEKCCVTSCGALQGRQKRLLHALYPGYVANRIHGRASENFGRFLSPLRGCGRGFLLLVQGLPPLATDGRPSRVLGRGFAFPVLRLAPVRQRRNADLGDVFRSNAMRSARQRSALCNCRIGRRRFLADIGLGFTGLCSVPCFSKMVSPGNYRRTILPRLRPILRRRRASSGYS